MDLNQGILVKQKCTCPPFLLPVAPNTTAILKKMFIMSKGKSNTYWSVSLLGLPQLSLIAPADLHTLQDIVLAWKLAGGTSESCQETQEIYTPGGVEISLQTSHEVFSSSQQNLAAQAAGKVSMAFFQSQGPILIQYRDRAACFSQLFLNLYRLMKS